METNIYRQGLQLFVEANESPYADGSSVPGLTDLSPFGRHLTADAPAPVIESAAVGGKKALLWDGTKNALKNTDSFQISCGFLVANITNFTNYNGLLSSLENYDILLGDHTRIDKWLELPFKRFEIRLNDRIYPADDAPAPVGEWGIIFFRLWQTITLDGVQLGGNRNFTDRKLNGKVALVALYDRGFCESEIRNMFRSIGYSYGLPIENVFPFQGMKADGYSISKKILSDGQNEPVLRLKRGGRKSFDFNFNNRSHSESKTARRYWDEYFPFKSFLWRDYNILPPEDTIIRIPVDSEFEFRGTDGVSVNYGFSGVESTILSAGAIPEDGSGLVNPLEIVTEEGVAVTEGVEEIYE